MQCLGQSCSGKYSVLKSDYCARDEYVIILLDIASNAIYENAYHCHRRLVYTGEDITIAQHLNRVHPVTQRYSKAIT